LLKMFPRRIQRVQRGELFAEKMHRPVCAPPHFFQAANFSPKSR
jgi:hypothetical protein